jgi:predicted esterase
MAARRPKGTRRWFYDASDSTNDDSLLILSRVERLEHEMQELKRAVVQAQEETKASLESVKDGLDNFMSSITFAE